MQFLQKRVPILKGSVVDRWLRTGGTGTCSVQDTVYSIWGIRHVSVCLCPLTALNLQGTVLLVQGVSPQVHHACSRCGYSG